MKKYLALSAAILAPMFSLLGGHYVSCTFGGDYPFHTDDSASKQKVGFRTGLSYGYKWDIGIRGEVEMTYRESHKRDKIVFGAEDVIISKAHQSSHGLCYMANVYYDIAQLGYEGLTPYAGVGIGWSQTTDKNKIQYDDRTNRDKLRDDRFAYQLIAGAKYPISDKMDLGAEYRYFCGKEHVKNHSFSLVLARNF